MPGLMFVLVDLLFLLPVLLLQNFAFCKLLCHELLFVEAVFSPQFWRRCLVCVTFFRFRLPISPLITARGGGG